MESLTSHDISLLLLGLSVMLAMARLFGELATYFKQPAIIGEILAGIILGPTFLGGLFPGVYGALFPSAGPSPLAFEAINLIAVVLLLLVAGLEVELSVLWRQGRTAFLVSVLGVVVPFALGFGLAHLAPDFWGMAPGEDRMTFALFLGTALSISALPVAARILMDLGIFKSDIGMLIVGAAMLNDLIGWIIFSVVLSMMAASGESAAGHAGVSIWLKIGLICGVVLFALTLLRVLINRVFPWLQARLQWPGGVLSVIMVLAFAGAALTEAIGIHAIFGAFLVGIAIGDSKHMREQTRGILNQFVNNIFAPLFFVSIGLRVDFVSDFNLPLTLAVLAISVVGKSAGTLLGARLGGLAGRERMAVTAGMNAHGAMEIILGLLALEYKIISGEMFVALVILALVGAAGAGPLISRFIVRRPRWSLEDLIDARLVLPKLAAATREDAIRELATAAASSANLDPREVASAALKREGVMGTGVGEEMAIPHARLAGLGRSVLAIGHSRAGIDFDAPDGNPAHLVFLLLTPIDDDAAQVQIISQLAQVFRHAEMRRLIYDGEPIDVLRAAIKIERSGHA